MANLHTEFRNNNTGFNGKIRLTDNRKDKLKGNRDAIKTKIREWFNNKKPKELQPKFAGQGSFEMNTIINPIPTKDDDGKNQLNYDLDYGVYFIEKENEDNKKAITTWHDWVYASVEDHTDKGAKRKDTCVRVLYEDGHHIDLPIYYKEDDEFELAHKGKGWLLSDPKAFYKWFNTEAKKNQQLRRIVRYLKAWKNFREIKNTNLKLPSGFALTILATNNYVANDNDDIAFRETIEAIKESLDLKFECLRPTTPIGEDVFAEFSQTRKDNFLNTLDSLILDCIRANDEDNFKKASQYLINNQFGDRFPLGKDESEKDDKKAAALKVSILNTGITHRPYCG